MSRGLWGRRIRLFVTEHTSDLQWFLPPVYTAAATELHYFRVRFREFTE
jgi:hypothetical protein